MSFLSFMYICNFGCFPFWFRGLVLIAQVPVQGFTYLS